MNTIDYPIKRLNRREFASALQKGLGRAYLHVSQYGLDGVSDLVLKACLNNQAYDAESEPNRAKWLFKLFKDINHLIEFSDAILSTLNKKTKHWDLNQLCELSLEFALQGDNRARDAIRKFAFRKAGKPSFDDWLGSNEWTALAGVEGAIDLARIYGNRLLANPNDNVPDHFGFFPINQIRNQLDKFIESCAQNDKALQVYRKYLGESSTSVGERLDKEMRAKRIHERIRSQFNLSSILYDAKNKIGDYPGHYATFGKHATTEELEIIFNTFLKEKNDDIRLRLLSVFLRSQVPRLDVSLFKLANCDNSELKKAAISALAQNKDHRIHELAIRKIKAKKLSGPDHDALSLFVLNYENKDAILITNSLPHRPNRDIAHSIVWSIIDIARQNKDLGLAEVLKWGYEKTPCSNCRHRVVVQLNEINQFNSDILYECQFDADEGTSALAREKICPVKESYL